MIVTKIIEKRYELTLDEKEMKQLIDIARYCRIYSGTMDNELVNKILEIE